MNASDFGKTPRAYKFQSFLPLTLYLLFSAHVSINTQKFTNTSITEIIFPPALALLSVNKAQTFPV